jgi:hypothetical protein
MVDYLAEVRMMENFFDGLEVRYVYIWMTMMPII